ncbi:hypothetical protein [Paenibacillus macerans]|uniref:hypothetical protein n=1 Tax=Paenibacillus macerans TaxID=44252 RepID=UPI00203DF5C8|nr:hypothetical protein [Paenibacillus macerans]MCM3701457.1 hypothetical protein [Paenibacillus macerans]
MSDAKVVGVNLSYAGLNGPIPVFKREVPKSGTVTLESNGISFRVLAGPNWNRYIYGPAYNSCRVTGEIHNTQYIERIKKEFPESDMKPLEMKENRFEYVDVGVSYPKQEYDGLEVEWDDPYFLTSGDSWIPPAGTYSDFVIVYRTKKNNMR